MKKQVEFKSLIERIYGEYGKHFIKTKFNSDDNVILNKTLKLHNLTIVVRFIFQAESKHYPQFF